MKKDYFKRLLKNRKFKKSMNIILSTVLIANVVGVSAETMASNSSGQRDTNRILVDREGAFLGYILTDKNLTFETFIKRAENGEWALCMEPKKPAPINIMYTKGEKIDDLGMKHIALSEPNMGSFEEDFYVKQVALNYYQGLINYIEGGIKEGQKYRDKAVEIANKAKEVRDGTSTSPYFANNSINATPGNREFYLDGEYYTTDWFDVSYTGDLQSYVVNLENAPNGTQVLNEKGVVVSSLSKTDSKFRLRVHRNNIDRVYNNIKISLTGTFHEAEATKYYPDDTTYQILLMMDDYPISKKSNPITGSLNPKGGIRLHKVSEDNSGLSGAFFELKKDGAVIKSGTTDSSGYISFSDLELGNYELVEKTAPMGHVLNSIPVEVIVQAGRDTLVEVTNEIIKGKVAVNKKDSEINSLMLEGAEFEIYDRLGNVVDKITTNADGYAESKLLNFGTYTMKEVKSPEGYRLDNTTTYTIQITEHNKTYVYDVENDVYKGKIHIVKIDSQNEETPVKGAGFDVIAEDVKGIPTGTIVEHVITDENGFAITGDLRYGEYKIREVDTPDGFWKPNKDYFIDIKEDGKTYVRYIKNDPIEAKIRVIKTDGKDKTILEGVKFKIVDKKTNKDVVFKDYVGGKVVDKVEFTTNEFGEFITPQPLQKGDYELVEIEGKEGYVIAEPIAFSIDENTTMEDIEAVGRVVSMEVKNVRITGNMKLSKVDMYTKEALPNVEFLIEGVEGFMKGEKFRMTSDENGIVQLNDLEYGKYKVTEIKTLEGYVLSEEPIFFDVVNDGETIDLTFENKPKEGFVDVEKIDSESKRKIKDVEFTIFNEDGEEISKLITDKNGKAKSDKLRYGKYTLVETKTPKGYIDNKGEFQFEILNEGEVVEAIVENDLIKGDLEFSKTDFTTGEVIEGAKIEIIGIDEINKHIKLEFISSKEGNKFKLPVGRYEFRETLAPNGYIQTTEVGTFEIKDDGEIVKAELKNKKMPKPIMPDTDENTEKPVTGDDAMISVLTSILAIIGLIIINKESLRRKE